MSAYRTTAPSKPLPPRCAIRFGELPPSSQDHLREVSAVSSASNKLERHTRVYAILAAVAGLFVLLAMGIWSQTWKGPYDDLLFDRRTPFDAEEINTVTEACFAVGVLLLGGTAWILRRRRAPLGTFWYAHKAYLFDCAYDRVVAYPLALLDDPEVMGETVHLSFGKVDVRFSFDTPAEAVSFRIVLERDAKAAAACLARGTVEEIEEADFIPDALLYRKSPRLPLDPFWAIPILAGIALALVGRVALPGLHASVAEARLIGACRKSAEVCAKYPAIYPGGAHLAEADDLFYAWLVNAQRPSEYKAIFPAGRHLNEVTTLAESTRTKSLARYRERAPAAKLKGDPAAVDALLTTLEALNEAQSNVLHVRITGDVDPDISYARRVDDWRKADAKAIADPELFGLGEYGTKIATDSLHSALLEAAGTGSIAINAVGWTERAENAAAELDVTYRIFKGPRTYTDKTKGKGPYAEIDIDWTLRFHWPKRLELGEVILKLHTVPSPELSSFSGSSHQVYSSMVEDDAKRLGEEVRRALGDLPPKGPETE